MEESYLPVTVKEIINWDLLIPGTAHPQINIEFTAAIMRQQLSHHYTRAMSKQVLAKKSSAFKPLPFK